jgi:dTDP-4-dehydrorhamnose reductase
MNSILIIGASGYLGGNLARIASSDWNIFLTFHNNKIEFGEKNKIFQLDIKNAEDVLRLIYKISPKFIVHTAAMTNLASCEVNKKEAWNINVIGTKNIALAAEQIKAKLIYISTDLVFDGTKGFYTEEDVPNPVCHYGYTKYEGEKIVSSICKDYIIARTSLIYGNSVNSSKCSAENLINSLKNNITVNLFFDEYRTPVYVNDISEIILELAELKNNKETYNICGSEKISRYQFGLKIAESFNLNKENIIVVSSNNPIYNKYNRPKDCSLSNTKVKRMLSTEFLSMEKGFMDMLGKS